MKLRRVWHGYLKRYPADPDTTLARHINWNRGYKPHEATAMYPEPLNLTAAVAWSRPQINNKYRHAIHYYDAPTKLWVMVLGILDVTIDELPEWILEQFSLGAMAVWTNDHALPVRPQPSYSSLDNEPGTFGSSSRDPVTLTIRLQEMNKYRVGDIDLTTIYPERFILGEKRAAILADYKALDYKPKKRVKSTSPRLPGQGSGNSRCVYTPLGTFPSIKLASQAHGVTISKMYNLVAGTSVEYGYLDKQEYLRRQALNNSNNQQIVFNAND